MIIFYCTIYRSTTNVCSYVLYTIELYAIVLYTILRIYYIVLYTISYTRVLHNIVQYTIVLYTAALYTIILHTMALCNRKKMTENDSELRYLGQILGIVNTEERTSDQDRFACTLSS